MIRLELQVVYTDTPELDLHLSEETLRQLPVPEQSFIEHYGFFDTVKNHWHLSHDHIRFCNHAKEKANISLVDREYLVALRDIDAGEELLQDYREIQAFEGRNLKD
ncbi:MAG: SET domain-containing protein-lysine N-methyltransferase [Endozoicomonas sp.]|uniref:SET domain-containing protein-lysine N-methyltransferase n=1 Tax=Endozoicomonas sp. TaxID=1892382 RepID=UPI003D9AFC14